MKRHNSMELSGHSFLNIYNENGPPDPPTPNPQIFYQIYPGPSRRGGGGARLAGGRGVDGLVGIPRLAKIY